MAVHHVQMNLLDSGDKSEIGNHDLTVVRTVEELSVPRSNELG
ncbi:MAG: hypothetical protein ACOC38_01730 [Promethearchaeia archaeon]